MNNCKLKNIKENIVFKSEDKSEKQFELLFETPDKVDSIQLSGKGSIKVSVSV